MYLLVSINCCLCEGGKHPVELPSDGRRGEGGGVGRGGQGKEAQEVGRSQAWQRRTGPGERTALLNLFLFAFGQR